MSKLGAPRVLSQPDFHQHDMIAPSTSSVGKKPQLRTRASRFTHLSLLAQTGVVWRTITYPGLPLSFFLLIQRHWLVDLPQLTSPKSLQILLRIMYGLRLCEMAGMLVMAVAERCRRSS